jgi:hypothetical protein
MFPFGMEQPSLIRELRGVNSALRSEMTGDQQKALDQIFGECREFFFNHRPVAVINADQIKVWKSAFEGFENRVALVLTPQQKANWETRETSLKDEQRYQRAMIFDVNRELSNATFARRLDLTQVQFSKLQQLGNQLGNRFTVQALESIQEIDDQVKQVLTPDQRSIWNQRQTELEIEFAEHEKNRAVKDAQEEAAPSSVTNNPQVVGRGRGMNRPNTGLQDPTRNTADKDRIVELQKQVDSLKAEVERLKTESTSQKPDQH